MGAFLAASVAAGCGDPDRAAFVGGGSFGAATAVGASAGTPSGVEVGDAGIVVPGAVTGGVVRSVRSLFDDPSVSPLYHRRHQTVTIQPFTSAGLGSAVRAATGPFELAEPVASPVWLRASLGRDVSSLSSAGPDETGRVLVPIYEYDAIARVAEMAGVSVPTNAGALVIRFVGRDGRPRADVSVEPLAGAIGPIARTLAGGIQRAPRSGSDGFVVFLAPTSSGMVAYTIGTERRTILARVEQPAISLLVVTTD